MHKEQLRGSSPADSPTISSSRVANTTFKPSIIIAMRWTDTVSVAVWVYPKL